MYALYLRIKAHYVCFILENQTDRLHITTNVGTWVWEKENPTSDIRKL